MESSEHQEIEALRKTCAEQKAKLDLLGMALRDASQIILDITEIVGTLPSPIQESVDALKKAMAL